MTKIIYFSDMKHVEEAEEINLGTWFLKKWPAGTVRPRGLKIYRDRIDESTDLTHAWLTDDSFLYDSDSLFIIAHIPAGGALGGITKIISAVLSPILKLLLPRTAGASANVKNNRVSSSNNALSGRTNEARPGERISDIRGGVLAYPDLLMDYRVFKNGVEYEVQLLCLGVGEYEISDVRDGITPASNITGESLAFYKSGSAPAYGNPYMTIGGAIDINQFPIFIAKASNETDGSEVKPPNYDEIKNMTFKLDKNGNIYTSATDQNDASKNIDWGERTPVGTKIVLTDFYSFQGRQVTSGASTVTKYTRYDLSGTYTVVYSAENLIQLDITGVSGWQYLNSSSQAAYLQAWNLGNGDWALDNSQGGTQVKFSPNVKSNTLYIVGPYLLENADEVMINLYAQNGIYKTDGDVVGYSVTCRMTLENAANPSDQKYTYDIVVKGNYTDAVGATLRVNNPYPDAANVYVQRISNTDKDFEGSVVDSVKWRDLYAVTKLPPRTYGDVTLIHTVTKATNAAIKQKERKLNMMAVRKYNGKASMNMADIIMSMHTDPYFGRRDVSTIDVGSLYDVQAQLLSYFGDQRSIEAGYTFDDIGTTYEEALQIICTTVNCVPYQVGNIIYFWPELPQSVSAMQFGHVFKIEGSDKRTRSFSPEKNYTGVQVKYFDHNQKSYQYVTIGEIVNLSKIDLQACQSEYLARIRANREYNKLQYQRVTHETIALSIGLQATPGMRVDMVDNTRMNQMEGVIEQIDSMLLILSDPVVRGGSNYTISITGRTGNLENIPIELTDDDYQVILKEENQEVIYTGWQEDRTAYVIRADDERSKLAMLVQTMEPQGKNNNYTVNLTAINYDDRYYKDDK